MERTTGETIKGLRLDLGLSRQAFADLRGITRGHIPNLETSAAFPSQQFIKLICREFGADEDWLKKGKGLGPSDSIDSRKALSDSLVLDYKLQTGSWGDAYIAGILNLLITQLQSLERVLKNLANNPDLTEGRQIKNAVNNIRNELDKIYKVLDAIDETCK